MTRHDVFLKVFLSLNLGQASRRVRPSPWFSIRGRGRPCLLKTGLRRSNVGGLTCWETCNMVQYPDDVHSIPGRRWVITKQQVSVREPKEIMNSETIPLSASILLDTEDSDCL